MLLLQEGMWNREGQKRFQLCLLLCFEKMANGSVTLWSNGNMCEIWVVKM